MKSVVSFLFNEGKKQKKEKKEESIYQIKEKHFEDLGLIEENILKMIMIILNLVQIKLVKEVLI